MSQSQFTDPTDYRSVHARSLNDPEAFWLGAAEGLEWSTFPTRALDSSAAPLYSWFPDGELNISHNALDRHVEAGRGDHTALIYDSAVTEDSGSYTYRQLRDEVAAAAGMLAQLGVGSGDRVLIYLPMIPQAPIAMLACARLGAVHSVVFGGFAAEGHRSPGRRRRAHGAADRHRRRGAQPHHRLPAQSR